jgi:predicted dehydrogenase
MGKFKIIANSLIKITILMKKLVVIILSIILASCMGQKEQTGDAGQSINIMTLDPGHFHAALVQKTMYDQVSPVVHIYAPEGDDLQEHVKRITSFNTRQDNPTSWDLQIYTGSDYLQKMISEKPGNLVVIAGNNRNKTRYIKESVANRLHVLSDKPMAIDPQGFELLKEAFEIAEKNDVLLYDIMTERYEITSMLQKDISQVADIFGSLKPGTPEDPSVTKESVHHFFKYVAGSPLKRPVWYFDVNQQGEGIVDVATHLVDLIQTGCYPGEILDYRTDIQLASARRWPTRMTRSQFERVTGHKQFPASLQPITENDTIISVYSNGEFIYKLKDVYAKVSVIWDYEAPAGAGDTHYSIMKGTKANLVIKQGKEQNYVPELYIEPVDPKGYKELLQAVKANTQSLVATYPGIEFREIGNSSIHVIIPQSYRVGHEAHFGQVTEKFLQYHEQGRLPDWEVPNMIAKYYTTTKALEMAKKTPESARK